jgi:hypothetical protein
LYKCNNYAFELGKLTDPAKVRRSPHDVLFSAVLGQDDFAKRQYDIVKFVDSFCRGALVAELAEDIHWYYCRETNIKVCPSFLYQLALTFISGGSYKDKQDELCRTHGIMSDDGDSIVDKYSGYVIRKLDFSSEEGYDEQGFKISTNDIIQKDIAVVVEEALKSANSFVFEGETPQAIFNILTTLSNNMGVSIDGIRDFVLRVTIEVLDRAAMTEAKYAAFAKDMVAKRGKAPAPYRKYRDQTTIIAVSAAFLVAIQTSIPPFRPKITAPGCVRSFSGFPMDGDGDDSGLKYIACVVHKSKSSVSPWDSVQRMPIEDFMRAMKDLCSKYILSRGDIIDRIKIKREYLELNPQLNIPEEHDIVKWRTFIPPVVPFSVLKGLRPMGGEIRRELLESIRRGHASQHDIIADIRSKAIYHGYAIVEGINAVVAKRDVLLKTSSNVPFLQNSCCNESAKIQSALEYFEEEDPAISAYNSITDKIGVVLKNIAEMTRAPVLYHRENTSVVRPVHSGFHFEENIYSAFIFYCNFDRDAAIPPHLRKVCVAKPDRSIDYSPHLSVEEKIQALKKSGKHYTEPHLTQLMQLVAEHNKIRVPAPQKPSGVAAILDLLSHMDATENSVIEEPMRRMLARIIEAHDPNVFAMEDSDLTESLKNYLAKSIQRMFDAITDFLGKYGNMGSRKRAALESYLANVNRWNIDRDQKATGLYYEEGMYSVLQFMRSAVGYLANVFPELILNSDIVSSDVPKHWNLSLNHVAIIRAEITNYYRELYQFRGDAVLASLLAEFRGRVVDLVAFVNHLPALTPIYKGGDTAFYSLFDKRTLYLIMTYCYYSAIYEFVQLSDDDDLVVQDIREKKAEKKAELGEWRDTTSHLRGAYSGAGLSETDADLIENMREIQISLGNKDELKRRAAAFLVCVLSIDQENKETLDYEYRDIEARMERSRKKEKDRVTDFFKNKSVEERKVAFLEKTFKMGRWNVSQKGLVNYDRDTFDKEIQEQGVLFKDDIVDMLMDAQGDDAGAAALAGTDEIARDLDEIEFDEERQRELEYDQEGMDISAFGDDYTDGNYYGDDANQDEWE